jgi:hypothetical protein
MFSSFIFIDLLKEKVVEIAPKLNVSTIKATKKSTRKKVVTMPSTTVPPTTESMYYY